MRLNSKQVQITVNNVMLIYLIKYRLSANILQLVYSPIRASF